MKTAKRKAVRGETEREKKIRGEERRGEERGK